MDSDKVMNLVTQLNYVSDELEEDLGRGGIKGKSVCRFALLLRCPCHVSSVWLWSVRLPPGPGTHPRKLRFFVVRTRLLPGSFSPIPRPERFPEAGPGPPRGQRPG